MKESRPRKRVGVAALLTVFVVGMAVAVNAPGSSGDATAASQANLRPKSGVWRGQTTQGYPVRFRVKGNRVGKGSFTVDTGPCEISYPRGINDWDSARVRSWFYLFGPGSDFFTGKFISRTRARGDAQASAYDQGCGGKYVRWRAHYQP